MAPIPDSRYFPSLERCLNGDQLLVSWKAVYSAITSNIELGTEHRAVIERFLSDPEVLQLLEQPFDAHAQPSAQTKAAFETKTSAINVTPSSSAKCDIKEIKEDSLWLSKIAKIDEISALRVVTEECQSRTSAQLLGQFSEEELASIRDAAGNSQHSSSIPVSLLVQGLDPDAIQQQFTRQDTRRQRIFRTYLSERRYILKCTERLVDAVLSNRNLTTDENDKGKGKAVELAPSWQLTCGMALASRWDLDNVHPILLRCVRAVGTNLKNLGERSGWSDQDGERGDIEIEWARNQFTEAIHALEIVWQFLSTIVGVPSSQIALEWFRLQQSFSFFNSFESDEPSIQASFYHLKSITTIISLGMLNLAESLSWMNTPSDAAEVSSEVSANEPFLLNTGTISEIQDILLQAADAGFETAGPTLLAWSLILRSLNIRVETLKAARQIEAESYNPRSSIDSEIATVLDPYEKTLEEIKNALDEDPIDFLARRAVNTCRVFQTITSLSLQLGNTSVGLFSNSVGATMRVELLGLIKNSTLVGYIPEIIEATLATLTGGETYWDILDSKPIGVRKDPVTLFLQDSELVNSLVMTARSRYPCEAHPFLQIIRALASCSSCHGYENSLSALGFLRSIPTFTYTLPPDFVAYETVQEEENANNIRLTQPVLLFEPRLKGFRSFGRQNRLLAVARVDEDFCIPARTCGRIISESEPKVAFWYHQYHGLKYFGKLLETFLAASDEVDATTHQPVDRESVSEIIGFIATFLLSIAKSAKTNPNSIEDALRVLEIASSGLHRNRDIISVIFDIFEEEVQNQLACSGADVPLEILVSCIHFIHAIIPISPGRVWPLLSRSRLLGVSRGNGRLPSIVESVELLSGRYEFLISCCRLYEALIEDFASNAIRRRSRAKSSARLNSRDEDIATGIPDQVLSRILLCFTRYLIDVLESSPSWKFVEQDDRRCISQIIAHAYNKVLEYAYGIETSVEAKEEEAPKMNRLLKSAEPSTKKEKVTKIMEALMPSALLLVDSFLSTSSGALRFQPLLRSYYDGLETPDSTVRPNQLNLWTAQANAALSFSQTLLRVSAMLERPASQLETQLFKVSSLVARLYVLNDTYRNSVVALFESLIVTASSNTSEPPSLLGHLGPQTAKNFLHVLSDLDKPLSRDENVRNIWHFLSKVVSSRQQWFANYLLTGKTPREALTTKATGKELASLDKSLLTTALEALSGINELVKSEALPMLEFVTLAQNFWPWTVCNSPKYSDFIKAISNFVGHFKPIQPPTNLEGVIDACYQTRIGAYIAEILAMHLFHARQTGLPSPVHDLLPNLSYFTRFAVGVPGYNNSLHAFLSQNFEARYPGCTLRDLKRTTLEEHQYGKEYFYDLQLADKMLSMTEAWTGRSDNGLRAELANANVNLSLVDAQIALFHSWKYLSIELSGNVSADQDLQKLLAKVASDCLVANMRPQPPEEIFSRLSQTRADFAIVLAQRLIQANSTVPEMQGLLNTTWDTIRALRGSFDRAVPGGDVLYYRSLLKLLFLAIRIHAEAKQQEIAANLRASKRMAQIAAIGPVIMDIIKHVVAIGIRELASVIHDSPADSSPEDLALITGILQSCLRTPGIELCHPQIVNMLTQAAVPRLAVTLFSWSDSLAIDGDPIYGELSMLFLLELSSMPLMAEQLAIDGVLGHLASANITSYLRRGGVGPFAESAGLQRCYSIWARGILPFLLNLLDAVQASLATEISLFLAQFPNLLKQSEQSLDAPETNRIIAKGTVKYITLTICSEVHSMALLSFILNGFRETLKGTVDIPEVKWDAAGVLENVEFWLGSRALLRERLLPMGEREMEMRRKSEGGAQGAVSNLEEKVSIELKGIRDVLSGGDSS